jgi:hypothetical protein
MKKGIKKLSLSRETLRNLDDSALSNVGGGNTEQTAVCGGCTTRKDCGSCGTIQSNCACTVEIE